MKLIFVFLPICVVIGSTNLFAKKTGSGYTYNGIGFSADYVMDRKGSPAHDFGLNASYRIGFVNMISGLLALDGGYQFKEKSVNGKAGIQALMLIFGLESGFCAKHVRNEKSYHPGGYLGLVFVIPSRKRLISISAGENFYTRHGNELYFRITTIFNFP
jgi:hypothetical protein